MIADQQVAMDALRRRLEAVRGEAGDRSGRGRGTVPPELADRLTDLEARLTVLERSRTGEGFALRTMSPSPSPSPSPESSRPAVEVPPTPIPTPRAQSPQEAAAFKEEAALPASAAEADYRSALQLIRQGQCTQAIPKLRDYVRKNPKSDLCDNAQYLIGSCYYGQRDYNRAIIELNEVLLKYPKADKVPASLLLLAEAFASSGDKIDARLILQKLITDHPGSEEAERGRQKLQSLSQ